MAARGRPQTNQKSLDTVKKELEVVPEEILDAIADNGTRLILVNKGEDPLDMQPTEGAPLLAHVEMRDYGPMLGRALEPVLAGVENVAARYDQVLPQVPDAQKPLLEQQRDQVVSQEIQRRTNGLVGLLPADRPTTLESIAQQHGAKTPEEVAQFATMVCEVSGPTRTSQAFSRATDPSLSKLFQDLPRHQRPVQGHLLVPNVQFFERDGERQLLHGPVANWANMTANGEWAGYYRSDVNTVFLREEYLGETNEGTSTPVHEFGHAFGDLLAEKYPAVFHTFKATRDETFVELHRDHEKQFPTHYSSVNASEFVAETFAVRFDPDRAKYPADGERWQQSFEEAIEHVVAQYRTA